jgi:predicted aldo/keto reductase-like oxidoreductase
MFQANPVRDVFVDGVPALYQACRDRDVGLVGMKPYDGGLLLVLDGAPTGITPVQCLSYALGLPVAVTLPGPKNVDEMAAALDYLGASEEAKAHDAIVEDVLEAFEGHCVYCSHCLPCPENIPISSVLQAADWSKAVPMDQMRTWYESFEAKASDCVACGECMERCPFGVDVVARMPQVVELFEA